MAPSAAGTTAVAEHLDGSPEAPVKKEATGSPDSGKASNTGRAWGALTPTMPKQTCRSGEKAVSTKVEASTTSRLTSLGSDEGCPALQKSRPRSIASIGDGRCGDLAVLAS